jgi:NAD-dependent SIR2 family protein deacetylase
LDCWSRSARDELEARLRAANRHWDATIRAVNPDGDVVLDDEAVASFRLVDCLSCGGVLKPDVVFFGENVPKPRVEHCYAMVDAATSLLVLGSSLTVMSGLRFVRHAVARGIPVGIVNQGPTRGDELADFRLDAPLGATLQALLASVGRVHA